MHKMSALINIERVNIGSFDDSMTSQSELEGTKIQEIFRRFQQTGVIPSVGRVAIPCDIVAGGYDFSTLRALIDEAKANGVTDEQLSSLFNGGSSNDTNQSQVSESGLQDGGASADSVSDTPPTDNP